jgi:hypothetical protein
MADNLELNAGSGGSTLRALDDGTVVWPVGVTAFATTVGTPDVPAVVTPTTGLPVRLADGSGYIATLPVSLASVPSHAVTNAGTFAVQATQSGTWTVTGAGGTFPITDSGGSITVDGTVAVTHAALTELGQAVQGGGQPLFGDGTVVGVGGRDGTTDTLLPILLGASGEVIIGDGGAAITVDGTVAATQSGAWNVGTVTTVTTVAAVTSITNALPAGTNLLGRVSASQETGTIYQGTTARTPAFAAIDAATSGDNTLVAAQGAGNKIRVTSLFLVAAGAVTARFESGAGGTALTGQMNLAANGGFVLPHNPNGWFETAANALLNLELSGAVSVDGSLSYIVVT